MGTGLEFGILGPLEVRASGTPVHVGGPRQRALLALLLCHANQVVSRDELIEELRAGQPAGAAVRMLQVQISRLRQALDGDGAPRVLARPPGYLLRVEPGELDLEVFEQRVAAGRAALEQGDPGQAAVLLGEAESLWRGRPLADLEFEPFARFEIQRLTELRLLAVEDRIEAQLALGRHGAVCPELGRLVAEHPLRERLRGQLMLALYRSGRQAEALGTYRTGRVLLVKELGIEPGPGLRRLHKQVLAADPALDPPAPAFPSLRSPEPAVVPRQLPAATRFFAGREAELKQLDELLDQVGGDGGAVVISAVAGMAGVGKTALAVHWARRVADRFPDGQLYVNLRGYDIGGAAVTAEEVAGWFLVALGVPTARIPADAQARCGLYRSELAGLRVLIVLDNARDAAQVRPLLPGDGGCLVVVTSRSSLAGLAAAEGAQPLQLGPLGAEEGVRLLAVRLGSERVSAEPEAVTELASWCGHLPLALAVIAARAAGDPGLPLSLLAAQLAGAAGAEAVSGGGGAVGVGGGRLQVLETGDPATSLRELLAWSHHQLSAAAAGMFALLGVHCGPDITVAAAASLAAVPREEAGRALAELTEASLAAEHRPGRYVLHDLVRAYAAEQAQQVLGQAEIRSAIERSLDHYLHTGINSSGVPPQFTIAPPAPGVLPEQLTGEAALLDWARAEHQVVLQAIAQASATGLLTHAWQLLHNEAWLVGGQGHWTDIQAAGQAVLDAAEANGDQAALGWAHLIIGTYDTVLGAGGEHLAPALDHFQQAGDLSGQAWAHLDTGAMCGAMGDWAEAITQCEQALALFRQTANQAGQGWALAFLGQWHARLGHYELARGYVQQAQQAAPATGDPVALATTWDALGVIHSGLGEHRQAIGCYRQALTLIHQLKNPPARALMIIALTELGDACQATGDLPAAAEAWQQALQVLDDMGWHDPVGIGARLEQVNPPSLPG